MPTNTTRRRFLRLAATATAASLAGCAETGSDADDGATPETEEMMTDSESGMDDSDEGMTNESGMDDSDEGMTNESGAEMMNESGEGMMNDSETDEETM